MTTGVNPFWDYGGQSPVVEVPDELFPHLCTLVERRAAAQTDDAGDVVNEWAAVLTNARCALLDLDYSEVLDWEQRGVSASHWCHFKRQPGGVLPPIDKRCRLTFGVRADGSPRRMSVRYAQNHQSAGVLLSCLLDEAIPPGGA